LPGDPVTDMLWGIIPYSFFYLLPTLAFIFAPYVFIIVMPYYLTARKKTKKLSA
jgi:hypothetical protein